MRYVVLVTVVLVLVDACGTDCSLVVAGDVGVGIDATFCSGANMEGPPL
jgi:hypothetical protein